MIAVALIASALPAYQIAPPLDVPVRQIQTEIRDDGRSRRTFRLERALRFTAEPGGYRATVTTVSVDADAEPQERARYKAANGGLAGVVLTVHLDRTGTVLSVDDLERVWAAWTGGLAATAESATGTAAIKRLADLPSAQRTAMLGAMVGTSLAPAADRTPAPERAVVLASPPPFTALQLTGTTATTSQGERMVTRTTATGASATGDVRVSLSVARTADPATGLLTGSQRRLTTSTARGTLTTTTEQTTDW